PSPKVSAILWKRLEVWDNRIAFGLAQFAANDVWEWRRPECLRKGKTMKPPALMLLTVGLMLVAGCAREQRGLPRLREPEHTVAQREEPKGSGLGKVLFEHQWQANDSLSGGDGLGPVFNARACSDCHSQGGVGGSGPSERNVLTFEVHPTSGEPHGQSGVVHTFAINQSCQENEEVLRRRYPPLNVGTRADDGANETTEHFDPLQLASVNTPALFGAGLIERISTQPI